MAKVRKKKGVRPSKSGKTEPQVSPASLPPQDVPAESASVTPEGGISVTTPKDKKPYWYVERGSKIHIAAMRILTMRAAGADDKDIAQQLDIKLQTLSNYVHMAQKSGLIESDYLKARDQLEFAIVPKALRNIAEALDDNARHQTSGMKVKDQVALKIVEGTVFKEFDQTDGLANVNTAIGINIIMPPGPVQQVREGAIGGVPAFSDGVLVDGDQ